MDTFTSLLTQITQCQRCAEQLPFPAKPIIQINPNAKILIAGHAPGKKAHSSGIPFDDPSGDRLRLWLGMNKKDFYDPTKVAILPMGFCYPGTGKSGDLPPKAECKVAWRAKVLAQLPNIEMTLVLGKYAQAYHFPNHKGSLTSLVQQWQEHWPNKVPLPHPSPRNNRWLKNNPWFSETLLPALKKQILTFY